MPCLDDSEHYSIAYIDDWTKNIWTNSEAVANFNSAHARKRLARARLSIARLLRSSCARGSLPPLFCVSITYMSEMRYTYSVRVIDELFYEFAVRKRIDRATQSQEQPERAR